MKNESAELIKSTKIAQITAYRISYGSLLQAFATQIAFKTYGMTLELFCFEPSGRDNFYRRLMKGIRYPNVIVEKTKEYWSNLIHTEYLNSKKKRDKEFLDFMYRNMVCTEVVKTIEQRDKKIKDYEVVLSGSDQTWNPVNFGEKYFTCEFVPDEIKLVSYASSFGREKIPNGQVRGTRWYLGRFSKISLRETSGREIVKKLTGKMQPVVLDPTLLLKADEWYKYVANNKQIDKNYIFTYFLSAKKEFRKKVLNLKQETGFQVITVPHVAQYVQADIDYSDVLVNGCAPDEWLALIKDAECICTDSYHGMIFSIIFKKQFIVMKRFRDRSNVSANTRIYEVLDKLGLENRLWNGGNLYYQMRQKIDYDLVEEKLMKYRQWSYHYIQNILNED